MQPAGALARTLCIVQPVLKQYRVPFFVELQRVLEAEGIRLRVVYGTPWKGEDARGDHADLPPPLGRRVRSFMLFGRLLLIPTLRPWLGADLVVVEHANKNLLNYLLAVLYGLRLKRVAYWSHGRDRQADPDSGGERFKRRSLHWADWWFAYTADSAEYVALRGFPRARITVVENAIDTRALRADLDAVTPAQIRAARDTLGWTGDERVAVYCGSLYPNKRLDLLFEAAERVHRAVPEFRLLVVGGGTLSGEVQAFAASHDWVRAVGPKFGREKSVLLRLAGMWLNPGALGLGILDAFCAGLPMLTTRQSTHGPEIEYLRHEGNGLLLDDSPAAYADGMLRLLGDANLAARLAAGARESARRYSIETMAKNFAAGVRACLSPS